MPDYQKTTIYKLCCKDPEVTDIYVGSTCNFRKRKHQHKSNSLNMNKRDYKNYVYQIIRKSGGFENWDMILIEVFPCNNKLEKAQRERLWMDHLKPTLNKQVPWRSDDEKRKSYKLYDYKVVCTCGLLVEKRKLNEHQQTYKHYKKFIISVDAEKIKDTDKQYLNIIRDWDRLIT